MRDYINHLDEVLSAQETRELIEDNGLETFDFTIEAGIQRHYLRADVQQFIERE